MEFTNNIKSPASPQEWYEAGVLLRSQERWGEAINAFRTAADLASATLSSISGSIPAANLASAALSSISGSIPAADLAGERLSPLESSDCAACAPKEDPGLSTGENAVEIENLEELRKIRSSSLAFIDLINEIRAFVNSDLMNP